MYTSGVNEESDDKKADRKDTKEESEDGQILETEETEEKPQDDEEQKPDKSAMEETPLKEANTSTTEKDSKLTGKKSEARHAESRYAEVPMSHMFCHICNKHMWDGYVYT